MEKWDNPVPHGPFIFLLFADNTSSICNTFRISPFDNFHNEYVASSVSVNLNSFVIDISLCCILKLI